MAISPSPLTFASAVVAAPGTSVDPSAPVPDNTRTVILLNTSLTDAAFYGVGASGGALTPGTDAGIIPAGAALTLQVGEIKTRGSMDPPIGLIFDGAAALTVNITYVSVTGVC